MELGHESPTDENESLEKKNQEILSELIEAGISERVAKAALNTLKPEDVDTGTVLINHSKRTRGRKTPTQLQLRPR